MEQLGIGLPGKETSKSSFVTVSECKNKEFTSPRNRNVHGDRDEENKTNANLILTQAEVEMNAFMKRIQSRTAVPGYALTDAVFCADRPIDAIGLDEKLPSIILEDHFEVNTVLIIMITEVYTPFQFWFRFEDYIHEALNKLNNLLYNFYNQPKKDLGNYCNHLSDYFIQPGYLCAAYSDLNCDWRRARIVSRPMSDNESVSIYYLDYGSGAEVSRTKLRFLSKLFTDTPAMAVRGCVSYIHPLGSHWSPESNWEFKRIVLSSQLYAHVTELDENERIIFMRISHNINIKPSINKLMVMADLAGKSSHYSKRAREFHCGRRLRYLRERLPSFDMLENRVYPMWGDEFEHRFDNLICVPAFYKDFEVPDIRNPFLCSLQSALATWLIKYKKEEKVWRKLYREANDKLIKNHFEEILALHGKKSGGDGKSPENSMKSSKL